MIHARDEDELAENTDDATIRFREFLEEPKPILLGWRPQRRDSRETLK